MNSFKPFLFLWLLPFGLLAEEDLAKTITSPNGVFSAQVGDVVYEDVEHNYGFVKIYRGTKEINEDRLVHNQKGMARSVYDSKWSKDSRFFVFLTKEVAGHSVWHSPTTVYDALTNKFIDLDAHIGAVVDDHVAFSGPDILKIKVMNPKTDAYTDPLVKEVSLRKLAAITSE